MAKTDPGIVADEKAAILAYFDGGNSHPGEQRRTSFWAEGHGVPDVGEVDETAPPFKPDLNISTHACVSGSARASDGQHNVATHARREGESQVEEARVEERRLSPCRTDERHQGGEKRERGSHAFMIQPRAEGVKGC